MRGLISAREDRRLGELAANTREQSVEVLRQIIDVDPEPLRIQRPAKVEKSERAQRERQVPLFSDLPADSELPPLSLLDLPPDTIETVSEETLEYTSRLIEKKLSDFGVSASRGRRLSRPGHHPLRDRAGNRRQGQPDRQPRQGPGAGAVGRVACAWWKPFPART